MSCNCNQLTEEQIKHLERIQSELSDNHNNLEFPNNYLIEIIDVLLKKI